jgi:seryl-tRNA synthetase
MQVQTATDPFFATVSAAKKFWQAAQEVKNEIKIPVLDGNGDRKLLACGSINLHGNFFGTRFHIASGGADAQTGCVGLGIERWVLAAFTQHGFDERRWPMAVRNKIFA